jgi:hypothetical protein
MSRGFSDPTALTIDPLGGRLLMWGKTEGRASLATLPLEPQEGRWPLQPSLTDTGSPGPTPDKRAALAFAGAADSSSLLFATDGGVVLTVATEDPLLDGVALVSLGQGTPTAGARIGGGNWYFAVQTEAETKILELRRSR